ncbi:hypothetical protein DPSP01_003642 [Paraphaeosphaeria sporulosa]
MSALYAMPFFLFLFFLVLVVQIPTFGIFRLRSESMERITLTLMQRRSVDYDCRRCIHHQEILGMLRAPILAARYFKMSLSRSPRHLIGLNNAWYSPHHASPVFQHIRALAALHECRPPT